jgi:membrane protein YdbS with pleckstrin-like domain
LRSSNPHQTCSLNPKDPGNIAIASKSCQNSCRGMQSLDPKVIVLFFIKNFLGTVYILPIWFIGVFIFEKVWTYNIGVLSEDVVILLLYGAGFIFFSFLVLLCYIWSWLTYIHFSYELQPDGLHLRSGTIIPRQAVIPYTDIEIVELLVNPLAVRFLNLYSICIKTREIDNTEGVFKKKTTHLIPGLTSETARFLRPELLKYSHIQKLRKTFFDPTSGKYI